MSNSEKRLALGLAGVLGCAFIVLVVYPMIYGPVEQAERKLKAATDVLDARTDTVEIALARVGTMVGYKGRSLSSNVSEASLGYEQWLSELAEDVAKFRDPKVSRESTSPSRDNSYVAIKIRVSGQGTMSQLREFLYRFHRANVLHQISSLSAKAEDNSSNPLLDIVILADGLSLRDAPVKGPSLFSRTEVVSVDDEPDRRLVVADGTAGWPEQTPFEIRVDDEYLTVLERVHQVWEVEGTGAPAAAGETVTLFDESRLPAGNTPAGTADSLEDGAVAENKGVDGGTAKPARGVAEPVTTKLVADWDGTSNSMTVALSADFKPGRLKIKIGQDILHVVARRGVWRIDNQKFRARAGTIVEASPVCDEFDNVTLAEFEMLTEMNPFAIKRTIAPDFLLTGERSIERGSSTVMTPMVRNLGPNAAAPVFEILSDLPTGMTYSDGKLNWNPPEDMEAGSFEVTIRASSDALESPLEDSFKVSLTVTKNNDPPVLWPPEDELAAVLGRSISFKVTATDNETPADELRFSAGDDFPDGASINPETGEVTWLPPDETQPGPIEFPITVADSGDPQQSTSATITVTVEDDRAMFTYLTASIAADEQRQAWFYDRSVNKRVIVQEGDTFKFAGFQAQILNIERDFVLMQQERDTLRVDIGSNLRQAIVIASAAPVEETPDDAPAGDDDTPGDSESPADVDAANAAELDALLKGLEEAETATVTTEPGAEDGNKPVQPPEPEQKSEPVKNDSETPDSGKPDPATPDTEKPAVEKPAVEKPAVEKPAVEKPAVEKPAVEKPAVEKPAVEKPAVE